MQIELAGEIITLTFDVAVFVTLRATYTLLARFFIFLIIVLFKSHCQSYKDVHYYVLRNWKKLKKQANKKRDETNVTYNWHWLHNYIELINHNFSNWYLNSFGAVAKIYHVITNKPPASSWVNPSAEWQTIERFRPCLQHTGQLLRRHKNHTG